MNELRNNENWTENEGGGTGGVNEGPARCKGPLAGRRRKTRRVPPLRRRTAALSSGQWTQLSPGPCPPFEAATGHPSAHNSSGFHRLRTPSPQPPPSPAPSTADCAVDFISSFLIFWFFDFSIFRFLIFDLTHIRIREKNSSISELISVN